MSQFGIGHLVALGACAAVVFAAGAARADYDVSQDPSAEKGPDPTVVVQSGEDGVAFYRCPALVTAPNGDLVVAVDVRKEAIDDMCFGKQMWVSVKRSTDNGKTWSKAEKVWDWPWTDAEKCSATDPSLVVDAETGRIFLFYTGCDFAKEKRINELYVQESADNGKTWTKPRELVKEIAIPDWPFGEDDAQHKANIFIPAGSGTQLRDGTLVHTITWATTAQIALLASVDHGKSWFIMGSPVRGGIECKVVELKSGALMINSRGSGAGRNVVVSPDRGLTWKTMRDYQVIDAVCNGQIIRAGDLILCSNCNSGYRRNLCVRASTDEGQTWTDGFCVVPGDAAYSDMTILKNGDLGVIWEGKDYKTVEFASVPMAEVLGGGAPVLEAAKADYARPIRLTVANEQAKLKVRREAFKYPPTFDFASEPSAAKYQFTVSNETGFVRRFFGKTATDSLEPIWRTVPVGKATVICEAVDAKNKPFKTLGSRTFRRDVGFRPGWCPKATRSYAEAAQAFAKIDAKDQGASTTGSQEGIDACEKVLSLLKQHPTDGKCRAEARELLRYCEDQFVDWTAPNIDGVSARMILAYLALGRLESNPLDLAKARALGNVLANAQRPNGDLRVIIEALTQLAKSEALLTPSTNPKGKGKANE